MVRRTRGTTLLAAAAIAAATMATAACGGGGGSGAGGSQQGSATTLTWQMWSGSQVETTALNKLSSMVTAKYPDIKLKIQSSTFGDYWTRLAAQASGGDVGCLLGVQAARGPSIKQLLLPLTSDRLSKAGIDLSQFDPTIVTALQSGGTQLAVPYDLGPLVMFYNADAFKKANLSEPKIGWTQADFEKDAKALTQGNQYGYAIFPTPDQVMAWSLALHGVQPVSKDGKLQMDSPQMQQTVSWLQGLVKQKVAPTLPATNDTSYSLNQFVAGNVAMDVDGPWQIGFVKQQAKFEVGIAPMPAGPNGTASPVNGSGFGISASCPYPDQALKALSVLTGPDALAYLGEAGRAYPARTAQQDTWYQGDLKSAKAPLTEAIKTGEPYRSTPNWTQVSQLFQQYGVPALNGQQTAQQFLTTVQQQSGS